MQTAENGARIVQVYRSLRRPDTYLYTAASTSLDALPDDLLSAFGQAKPTLRLWLTPEKRLARMSGAELLSRLDDRGYYLQLPDPANSLDDQLADLALAASQRSRTEGVPE